MNRCHRFMSSQVVDNGGLKARDGSYRNKVRNNVLQGGVVNMAYPRKVYPLKLNGDYLSILVNTHSLEVSPCLAQTPRGRNLRLQ